MAIDYVVPDYYATRPKPCMGGWGMRVMVVTPSGRALPCHAAETLPGLDFPSVTSMPLAEIWNRSDAFRRYRGTGWMRPPCRDCERRELDWGGCRCQALALTGDAARTDPACALSPDHPMMAAAVASAADVPLRYRGFDAA
jgi:pyrroloquinoline quinone biosynthesis protein E